MGKVSEESQTRALWAATPGASVTFPHLAHSDQASPCLQEQLVSLGGLRNDAHHPQTRCPSWMPLSAPHTI